MNFGKRNDRQNCTANCVTNLIIGKMREFEIIISHLLVSKQLKETNYGSIPR